MASRARRSPVAPYVLSSKAFAVSSAAISLFIKISTAFDFTTFLRPLSSARRVKVTRVVSPGQRRCGGHIKNASRSRLSASNPRQEDDAPGRLDRMVTVCQMRPISGAGDAQCRAQMRDAHVGGH